MSKAATKRLLREYQAIRNAPPPFIVARPEESNILEWHYVITGPPDTPFAGGEYHGKLVFPNEYPFKPPSIQMITPNGRFKTCTRLCLTMSDFHRKPTSFYQLLDPIAETWNPAWSVASILTGLLSFMLEKTATTGSLDLSDDQKRSLAQQSRRYNRRENHRFKTMFPDLMQESEEWKAPETTDVSSSTAEKLTEKKVQPVEQRQIDGGKKKKAQNVDEEVMIISELKALFQSPLLRMVVGGFVFYSAYQWLTSK